MDLSFSPEQEMLRAQARSFLERGFPAARVAALAGSEAAWDPASWQELAALGWIGASVPEAHGGAGLGFLEEAVLLEELGRALYPGPYFSTVVLALPALAMSDELVREVAAGGLTATLAWREPSCEVSLADSARVSTEARGTPGGWRISGEKRFVPDAGIVDRFVVVARAPEGVALFLVDHRDAAPHALDTVDATRRLGRVAFEDSAATLLAPPSTTGAILRRIRVRALAALAIEAVGVASQALAHAQQHARARQQFGRPIGAFQAVSHKVADIYVDTELARSLAYWAAWCVAVDDGQAPLAAAAAKASAADAAIAACERAIQVHGGMGFTWEHILHRYYKRALWISSFEASGAALRAEVASALLGG